jgi:hypothetical protein
VPTFESMTKVIATRKKKCNGKKKIVIKRKVIAIKR